MKLRWIFVVFLMIAVFLSVCMAENDLSESDKKKIAFILKVKEFAKSIGLEPTNNFKEYRNASTRYNLFFYNKKTDVPFSYIDPLLVYQQSDYDNLASSVIGYEIDITKYDVYFYTTLGIASGTYITRNLLDSGYDVIADVVLHEDMHDNTNLPRHIDEATALLIGIAGSSKFMQPDQEDFGLFMEYLAMEANTVKNLHKNILDLNKEYKNGKITFEKYLAIRDMKLAVTNQISMASVVQHHTYLFYLPKLIRIFRAMDYNLKSFVGFMKSFPYKEPLWNQKKDEAQASEEYFQETLRVEAEADIYLDKKIDELESKQSPSFKRDKLFWTNLKTNTSVIEIIDNLKEIRELTKFRYPKPVYE